MVLYTGPRRMRMADGVDLGETKGAYRLIEIRKISAEALLRSRRPGDWEAASQRHAIVHAVERARIVAGAEILGHQLERAAENVRPTSRP